MNALGQNVQPSQRRANPPLVIQGDSDYYRNKNITASAFAAPVRPPIRVSNVFQNTYRNTWSNTNPELDYQDLIASQKATKIADFRRQDVLRETFPSVPNTYNNSGTNEMGFVKIN